MIELVPDEGWDTQIVPGGSTRGFKSIKSQLLDYGLVSYSKGNTYIYLSASNSWAVLVSAEAQIQLCGITGSDNVSVSYLGACIPYFGYLEKHARRTSSIPMSVCLGTWRLSIHPIEQNGVEKIILNKMQNIASIGDKIDSRVSSFCVMPCSYDEIPPSWTSGGPERLLRYLLVLFPDSERLLTVMWIVGNAIVDPGSFSKFLLLYGPGGTGKSTLIKAIETLLKGCCSTIKPSTLTDPKDDISLDTAKAIASNRMLTAGDINLESSKLNLHNIKVMTGHDSISVPPIKVTTRCSIIAGCNDLPDPTLQTSWNSTAIGRRAVVILMNVNTALIPKREMPDTTEDLLDFVMMCVNARIKYSDMPITIKDVLYTILADKYNYIEDKIEITDNATDQEMFDANMALDVYMKKQPHTLGEHASVLSANAIKIMGSLPFIRNIRLISDLED